MKKNRSVIFSGIQPSGNLNIGGYIGAIKNWVMLQDEYDCLFSLVDLHTITVRQDPNLLRQRMYDFLVLYIACGLDPKKSIIFCQSHVAAHAQLAWILNCYTYMGELGRMTQFKEKSKKHAKNINIGLFAYPVLQAADILLYQTNLVPVGFDQKQHIELARDIATRFNGLYGEIFTIPEPYIAPANLGGKIMSLSELSKKMSKSDTNDNNTINLLDSEDIIIKKMQRAVTDSGNDIHFHESKPGVSNLLCIYSNIANKSIEQLEKEYSGKGYGVFKNDLAQNLIEFLKPIQKKYSELRQDQAAMNVILKDGAGRAQQLAQMTLDKVHEVIGLIL
jgi:tryptophanyl-tRNA synthetase